MPSHTNTPLDTIRALVNNRANAPFTPTDDHRRAKSVFWSKFSDGAITPPAIPSITIAAQYASDSRIRTWWSTPGFPEWFWNTNEFEERLDYLGQLALDELEVALKSPMLGSDKKLPAIKLALELSGRIGTPPVGDMLDSRVAAMTQKQLEEFIASRLSKLPETNKLTATDISDTVPTSQIQPE